MRACDDSIRQYKKGMERAKKRRVEPTPERQREWAGTIRQIEQGDIDSPEFAELVALRPVQESGACPGYVVDHVVPLKRGAPDRPSNMQWQRVAEGKAKDKVE